MPNYIMTAKYTQFFKDFIPNLYHEIGNSIYADFYTHYEDALTDDEWTGTRLRQLTDMIINKYEYYEVFTEYDIDFDEMFISMFRRYKDYYYQMLIAYETEINFLDGNKVTRTYEPRVQYEADNYDLPRSSSSVSRPTTKSINAAIAGTDTTVIKGGDVIELKRRYLDLIRNLYDEFASKFQPLFIEMFDWEFEEAS